MNTDLILFLMAAMFSPGPNIIMLTTSGARFGVNATAPHLFGVVIGVGIIGAVSGLGIGALIAAQPSLQWVLQCASAVWILWMAYRLLLSDDTAEGGNTTRPMRFWEAVIFQWVNPKIWAIALAASSGYTAGLRPLSEALQMGLSFSGVNFFVCVFWTFFGALLTFLLNSPKSWQVFRITMAALLAMSAGLVFW